MGLDTLEGAAAVTAFEGLVAAAPTAVFAFAFAFTFGIAAEASVGALAEPEVSVGAAANTAPTPMDNNTDNAVSLNVFMMCPLFESYSPKSWSTYSTPAGLKVLTQIINYLCQP